VVLERIVVVVVVENEVDDRKKKTSPAYEMVLLPSFQWEEVSEQLLPLDYPSEKNEKKERNKNKIK
jgi:hypothetical protein